LLPPIPPLPLLLQLLVVAPRAVVSSSRAVDAPYTASPTMGNPIAKARWT
jgi:hypothetical protein